MKTHPLLTVLFLPALLLMTNGCQSPKPVSSSFASGVYSSGSDIGGTSYMAKLSAEALLAAPPWSPKRDRPPLAPGVAKQAAMTMLSQTVSDMRQWRLEEITLMQPFDGALGAGFWVYKIRFSGPKYKSQFGSDMGSTANLLVLMNGQAVALEANHAK
jgi:hypothetical protein